MSYSSKARRAAPYRHTGRRSRPGGSPLMSALFFPAAILYHELLLRAFDRSTPFFDLALLRILLFSLAAGLLLFLILDLLPWKPAARIAGGVMLGLGAVLFCVERGCRATFNLYYGLGFMGGMAGDVTGDFGSTVASVVLGLIPFILLSFVPLAAYVLLRNMVFQEEGQESLTRIILAVGLVIFQLGGWALSAFGAQAKYYTYEYTANVSIPHFGVVTSLRLELEYAVAGIPAPGRIHRPGGDPRPHGNGEPGSLRRSLGGSLLRSGPEACPHRAQYAGYRLQRPGGIRVQPDHPEHPPVSGQPHSLGEEPVYRNVQGEEPDPAHRRGLLPLRHRPGADPHPVQAHPRRVCVQQLLPAGLDPVHLRRRVRRHHRHHPQLGERRAGRQRQRGHRHAQHPGQAVRRPGVRRPRVAQPHLHLLRPGQVPGQLRL